MPNGWRYWKRGKAWPAQARTNSARRPRRERKSSANGWTTKGPPSSSRSKEMATTMERHDTTRHTMPEKQAKQATNLGTMRYVLGVSLLLAVIAGFFLYLAFFY